MTHQEETAFELLSRAMFEHGRSRLDLAVELAREAVIMYAAADSAAASASDERVWARAAACKLCGDYLAESEKYAESAKIYQEAVDQFARLDSENAEVESRKCAHKLLECIDLLRTRPFERLNLLIARYEHLQRQYAVHPGQERQQAECAAHIARILARRERYVQAADRYIEALELYVQAGDEPETCLAIAECYHRLAGLLAYRLNRVADAVEHYRNAITLYAEHEPYVYGKQDAKSMCERALRDLG